MPADDLLFPPTSRDEALQQLNAFLPRAASYATRRNHVVPGHGNVSRLSPATRTRLLLETEIGEAARKVHLAGEVEKFEQEVWWRLYWKGWLEMRPAVWDDYRDATERTDWSERAEAVAAGRSGVAIMDHFARELVETGYLHNHARMWWAAFWIHVERLPWQLGADFFFQHLHDGDAASNTLSWRWVAGLHTRGKAYLVRRSNMEKYVGDEILSNHSEGLERLEGTVERESDWANPPSPEAVDEGDEILSSGRTGVWIHDEDCRVEDSPLSGLAPAAVRAFFPISVWNRYRYPEAKRRFLGSAVSDAVDRTGSHFGIEAGTEEAGDLPAALAEWAAIESLDHVVALRPCVGPLADELPAIRDALVAKGTSLRLVRRKEDVAAMNKATAGFFGFWKKTESLRN